MVRAMDDAVARIERAAAAVDPAIRSVTPQQLSLPTPCEEWDLRTLLDHLLNNLNGWAETVQGRERPGDDTSPLRDSGDDVAAAWQPAREVVIQAFSEPGALDREVQSRQGPSSARMLAAIAPLELMLHGWDVARSIGAPTDFDPELAEELLVTGRKLMEGRPRTVFGEEQPAPPDATAADRLAAFYGRPT
jgi:uncharacterized protein (TIGR03086 family)